MIVARDAFLLYMSDVHLTADQQAAVEDVLAGVQAELEVWLNRPVEVREIVEVLTPDDDGYVRPRVTPVVSVTSISGVTPVPTYSKVYGLYVGFTTADRTVTYEAGLDGFATEHANIRLAIMRVAKREITKQHDDTLGVKDLTTSDGGETSAGSTGLKEGWQDDELKRLSRYRRRVI